MTRAELLLLAVLLVLLGAFAVKFAAELDRAEQHEFEHGIGL